MPSKISVDQIAHSNETNALEIDTSGNVTIQQDLKFAGNAAIKDSAGNNVISESAGVVTVNADAAVISGSSTGDLVRITQTGTGNALVVEDSANPDSTPFVVNSSGNVGIGTSSPSNPSGTSLTVFDTSIPRINLKNSTTGDTSTVGGEIRQSGNQLLITNRQNSDLIFGTNNTEKMRIDSDGHVLIGTTSLTVGALTSAGSGVRFSSGATGGIVAQFASNGNATVILNRTSTDGSLVSLRQNGTEEGTITVSGSTVSYNGFTGTHWSRLLDGSTPDIPRGTILESLDEMMDWVKEDGTLEDDIKHVKCKISDTVESKNVYGLFFAWDNEDDYNDLQVAQVGSFVIRIHSSQNVQRGDLIQSNGDGTGKIQADDIIRSSTVAKVISNHRVETYEDGSYIVPCVIHC